MYIRHNWSLKELEELYQKPLLELISQSHLVHTRFHVVGEIQICSLLSIKTGGCPENCQYCPQSSHYTTTVSASPMMSYEKVLEEAKKAIEHGATRFCLGVAWREVREGKQWDAILKMVRGIADLGIEVCCTLGMLTKEQAEKLKEAGLYAYNHNLDTSKNFYPTIITTRTYQDRLNTLDAVEKTGLSVCCGGIIGMGETPCDRLELLLTLSQRDPHPESVPINKLVRIPGTPLENQPTISFWEIIRVIAIARIALPQSMVRLSCGRMEMSYVEQTLCFFAGANSIFMGEKLLTTGNNAIAEDQKMFEVLGLKKQPPFAKRVSS